MGPLTLSLKATVPVGTPTAPAPFGVRAKVKVTLVPNADGEAGLAVKLLLVVFCTGVMLPVPVDEL
jgi:hypothetical protein